MKMHKASTVATLVLCCAAALGQKNDLKNGYARSGLVTDPYLLAPAERKPEQLKALVEVGSYGNTGELFVYILTHPTSASIKASLWQAVQSARLDQQTGTSAVSAGSTAIVSKGVASLLGVALESGAVSRTTSDNVATLTVSTSELAALLSGGRIAQCSLIDDRCGPLRSFLRSTTVAASFDIASSSTSNSSSLSQTSLNAVTGSSGSSFTGLTVREDFHVRKKSVDTAAFRKVFSDDTTHAKLLVIGETFTTFNDLLRASKAYVGSTDASGVHVKGAIEVCVDALREPTATSKEDVVKAIDGCEASFSELVQSDPALVTALQNYAAAAQGYFNVRDLALSSVLFNTTFSASYDFTRAAKQPAQPSLSNLTFVYSGRYNPSKDGNRILQVTGNGSSSFYNDLVGSSASRLRSAQGSAQLDYTATPTTSNVQAALSGGYYFQYMVSDGLLSLPATALAPGTAIPISGTASQVLNTKGPIHIGQAKITLSLKNKNISVPFALTFASRSDLLKASRVTGNFGISYDFGSLLSGK